MDTAAISKWVNQKWDSSILPTLMEYIKIPNVSPGYDNEWKTNGLLDKAANLLVEWVKKQNVPNLEIEIVRLEGKTPLIFITIPSTDAACEETVLLYGHLDKQPPMTETWEKGLGPYTPVVREDKLYGRGGADDGYSIFAAIASIQALEEHKIPHARCTVIIEACEESGSPDLPAYVQHLEARIGTPSLIVCLDSGCGNYKQFWITTSLRGLVVGDLKVEVLREGAHSGHASGIVPSSFRIARLLLDRLEKPETGAIIPKVFHTKVPAKRMKQIKACADALGSDIYEEFPWVDATKPVTEDVTQLIINRTWMPALSVTGAEGLPTLEKAGNVLRTYTTLKLSLRIPPTVNANKAKETLKELMEEDPPYNAKVTLDISKAGSGWESPQLAKWLEDSLDKASNAFFGLPTNFIGEGGSIPFMGMLGEKFPKAQFVITGVLGPKSNAHGPNEFLHIPFAKNVTCCVASILADHYNQVVNAPAPAAKKQRKK